MTFYYAINTNGEFVTINNGREYGEKDFTYTQHLNAAMIFNEQSKVMGVESINVNHSDELRFISTDSVVEASYEEVLKVLAHDVVFGQTDGEDIATTMSEVIGEPYTYDEELSTWVDEDGEWIDSDGLIDAILHLDVKRGVLASMVTQHSTIDFCIADTFSEGFIIPFVPSLDAFTERANELIGELEGLSNKCLKNDGLTSEECQKVGFDNALFDVSKLVNGTTKEDIVGN